MGNEIAWPCTNRKEQERKVRESKFDMSYWEELDTKETPKQTIPNMMKVETILSRQNEYIRYAKPHEKTDSTTKSSPREKIENENAEYYEAEQAYDGFPPILLTSRVIEPFQSLIEDLETLYDGVRCRLEAFY